MQRLEVGMGQDSDGVNGSAELLPGSPDEREVLLQTVHALVVRQREAAEILSALAGVVADLAREHPNPAARLMAERAQQRAASLLLAFTVDTDDLPE